LDKAKNVTNAIAYYAVVLMRAKTRVIAQIIGYNIGPVSQIRETKHK
jgi:hypothetical protein